ncbi:MAG: hypothetical protein ACE5FK_11140 [Candidatus Methylomirabilia bacterium]
MAEGRTEWVIEYEPRLVEETVLLALRDSSQEAEFRKHRDRLYQISDLEEREAGFRALHASWFAQFGLGEEIARAFVEQPSIAANADRSVVFSASSGREEGAELFVSAQNRASGPARRTVVLRVRPATLTAPQHLRGLLRHELLHIADMLDPHFGYEPRLPVSGVGPAHDLLLRDRYRVLWDAFIDGRLLRFSRVGSGVRAERLSEFAQFFPVLGGRTEEAFERFFRGSDLTHAELVAFATDPERALGRESRGPRPGGRCPLCGFPTHAFEPDPDQLPDEIQDLIRERVPRWEPADGLCQQCADLFRSRRGYHVRSLAGARLSSS